MSRWVDVTVEVSVRAQGTGSWIGRGRDLPEALAVVRSYMDEKIPQEERAAMAAALDRGSPRFDILIVSMARWWNPFTWGTFSVEFTQGSRSVSGCDK